MSNLARKIAIAKAIDPNARDLIKTIFFDPRDNGSLRLTVDGYDAIKDRYPHWSESLPEKMTMANHTYLVAVSIFPYYLSDKLLTTFDPDLGVLIKMVSGDFEKLERLHPRD